MYFDIAVVAAPLGLAWCVAFIAPLFLPLPSVIDVPVLAAGVAGGALYGASWAIKMKRRPGPIYALVRVALAVGIGHCLWQLVLVGGAVWQSVPRQSGFLHAFGEIQLFISAYKRTLIAYPYWSTGLGASLSLLVAIIAWQWSVLVSQPLAKGRARAVVRAIRTRAGWMMLAEAKKLTHLDAGLPLGLLGSAIARYEPSAGDARLGGHHMIIAGTRAGKGVACVLPATLDHGGPVVAIDIKGEIFATCRRYRAALGRQQVTLNPFGLIDGKSSYFNPLTYPRRGPMLLRDIAVLADGLVIGITGEDGWIATGARRLVEAGLELIMTVEPVERQSLAALAELLLGPTRLSTFEAWRTEGGDLCDGRIAQAGGNIMSMGDRQRGAVLDHLDASLDWLKYKQMRQLTDAGKPSFSFDALLAGKVDLYVVVPQDMVHVLAGFARVVLNTVLGVVTRQDGHSRLAQTVLVVADEFTRLGHMQKMIEIATIAAGAGVEAMFVVQDLETLERTYRGESRTILGACATTRIFGLGSGDDKTARWAESLMPYYAARRWNRTRGSDGKISRTQVETKERLLSMAELLELPPSVMLTRIRSKPPMLLNQIVSHAHHAYRQKLDRNPVVRA